VEAVAAWAEDDARLALPDTIDARVQADEMAASTAGGVSWRGR
jgi:hypothetical protein